MAAQGAPPKRDKESDEGNSGTIDEELDAVARRAPPLALRDVVQPHPWLRWRPRTMSRIALRPPPSHACGWTSSRLASTLKTDPSGRPRPLRRPGSGCNSAG